MDAHTSPQDHLNGSQSVSNPTLGQLVRFVVVGTSLNLMLYACYLAMVSAQFGSKLAMSVAYGAGVAFGFVLNRRWSFGRGDAMRNAGLRYVAVCVGGYFLNLCALLLFVDAMGFAHQIVQAVMVFVIAAMTFLLQKLWVFRSNEPIKRLGSDVGT